MRPFHKTFALLGILLPACNLETPFPENLVSPEECTVNVTVGQEPLTKSILPSGIENRLDNAFVLVTGADGFSRYKYFDFTSAQQSPSVNWRMPAGRDYTVYAVGNMGNISPSLPQTEEGIDMTAFRYEVPAYSSLTALPMAKVVSLPAGQLTPGASILLSITLERLMARVNVRINKSGITGGVAAQALQSASLHLRQVAKALYPFRAGGSLALTDADVTNGGVTDACTIHKGSLIIDGKQFVQAVLVPVAEPPGGIVNALNPAEVSGAGPESQIHAVHFKMDVTGPVLLHTGGFRGYFHGKLEFKGILSLL